MESVSNKITNNSLVVFLLMLLCASQVVSFVRLGEHREVLLEQSLLIDELAAGQVSLYEIIRLQEKLHILELKNLLKEPIVPKWNPKET